MPRDTSAPPPERRQITVDRHGEVFRASLTHRRMDETQLRDLGNELIDLARAEGCRKLALSLGTPSPQCLYSVFLGQLVRVQRELARRGCALVICDAAPEVRDIFAAARLDDLFVFVADFDAAVAHFTG